MGVVGGDGGDKRHNAPAALTGRPLLLLGLPLLDPGRAPLPFPGMIVPRPLLLIGRGLFFAGGLFVGETDADFCPAPGAGAAGAAAAAAFALSAAALAATELATTEEVPLALPAAPALASGPVSEALPWPGLADVT